MARGQSGRLVADIDPELKKQFHAALTLEGTSFKDWVLLRISDYLEDRNQPKLPGLYKRADSAVVGFASPMAAESSAEYKNKKISKRK